MFLLYFMVALGVFIECGINKQAKTLSALHKVIVSILWPILVGILLVTLCEKEVP